MTHPQWLNVLAGILRNNIVGALFISGNSTGGVYLDMLENAIKPLIREIIENNKNHNVNSLHFQQEYHPTL